METWNPMDLPENKSWAVEVTFKNGNKLKVVCKDAKSAQETCFNCNNQLDPDKTDIIPPIN